jgi:hypothetical protein
MGPRACPPPACLLVLAHHAQNIAYRPIWPTMPSAVPAFLALSQQATAAIASCPFRIREAAPCARTRPGLPCRPGPSAPPSRACMGQAWCHDHGWVRVCVRVRVQVMDCHDDAIFQARLVAPNIALLSYLPGPPCCPTNAYLTHVRLATHTCNAHMAAGPPCLATCAHMHVHTDCRCASLWKAAGY